jgi:hypothetical protein
MVDEDESIVGMSAAIQYIYGFEVVGGHAP